MNSAVAILNLWVAWQFAGDVVRYQDRGDNVAAMAFRILGFMNALCAVINIGDLLIV